MDHQALAENLNRLLEIESRSLVRHLEKNATPYLSPETYHGWKTVEQIARISHDHEHRLTDLMVSLSMTPRPGNYRAEVANYHDIDLPTLLTQLIQEKQRQRVAYQRVNEHAGEVSPLRQELGRLLADIEDQLQRLKELVGQ